MTETYTIYAVRNTETDQRYIGIAKDFIFRKGAHLTKLRHGKHDNHKLQKAFNEYGDKLVWEVVESGLSNLDAAKREHYWIHHFDCLSKGYNISEGMYCSFKGDFEIRKDLRTSWASVKASTELRAKLRLIAMEADLVPDYYTEKHSPLDLGVMNALEAMITMWDGLSVDEKLAVIAKTPKPAIGKVVNKAKVVKPKAISPVKVQIIRNFEIEFICEECKQLHNVGAITYGDLSRFNPSDYLQMYEPFCCEGCGADDFTLQTWKEIEKGQADE